MMPQRKLFQSSKKVLSNGRKRKSFYKQVLGLIFLFCLTLFILFCLRYVTQSKAKYISPVPGLLGGLSRKGSSQSIQEIQSLCQKYALSCTKIEQGLDDNATITVDTGTVAVISFSKDIDKQIASLQLTISRLTIEGKKLSKIDFRFDRPVVSF